MFAESVLTDWGRRAHLGAASPREQRMLGDALLEPDAHRRMASAMQATAAVTSDGDTFRLLGDYLDKQRDPLSARLAAILSVASSFENLHRELLYRFDQVLASSGHHGPVALKNVQLAQGDTSLARLGDELNDALAQRRARLPHPVAEAVHAFSLAVAPAVRAQNDAEQVRNLIRHHERVQAGKLDASRQPKRPWVELRGSEAVIDSPLCARREAGEAGEHGLHAPVPHRAVQGHARRGRGLGARIVKPRRLIELWEPPQGYRLVSVVATTYELHADFLEEDLLPAALGLRLPPARGRDFRLELERALENTEVSVFFHPGRYQPGLRRSPRIDLIPLPEGRGYPKLHAKVALLRFVDPAVSEFVHQIVRLVVTSANLTSSGYRSNIEVAAAIDDAPGASSEAATAVRDAADWLELLVGSSTDQMASQLRHMKTVFGNRSAPRRDARLRFIGLPSTKGFPPLVGSGETVDELTIASPFWPTGGDLADVAADLSRLCGGHWENGTPHRARRPRRARERFAGCPRGPRASSTGRGGRGCRWRLRTRATAAHSKTTAIRASSMSSLSAADSNLDGNRSLHAKALLAIGSETTRLAIGSFNLTRKGLGLARTGNAEAGLLWTVPTPRSSGLRAVLCFGTAWRNVTRGPEEFVIEPPEYDGDDEGGWPVFIRSLRAKRDELIIEGDAATWPREVVIRMKDIRSRLLNDERWFDPWTVRAPADAEGVFSTSNPLRASWLDQSPVRDRQAVARAAGSRSRSLMGWGQRHSARGVRRQAPVPGRRIPVPRGRAVSRRMVPGAAARR